MQTKGIKEKPFKFALLNSKEDDTDDDFLKKEMVVERGMVGQGLLYIRMKVGFEFVLNENHTSESDSELVQGGN